MRRLLVGRWGIADADEQGAHAHTPQINFCIRRGRAAVEQLSPRHSRVLPEKRVAPSSAPSRTFSQTHPVI